MWFTRSSFPISYLLHSPELLRVPQMVSFSWKNSDLYTILATCLANSFLFFEIFLQVSLPLGSPPWLPPPLLKLLKLFPNEAISPSGNWPHPFLPQLVPWKGLCFVYFCISNYKSGPRKQVPHQCLLSSVNFLFLLLSKFFMADPSLSPWTKRRGRMRND